MFYATICFILTICLAAIFNKAYSIIEGNKQWQNKNIKVDKKKSIIMALLMMFIAVSVNFVWTALVVWINAWFVPEIYISMKSIGSMFIILSALELYAIMWCCVIRMIKRGEL